MANSESKKGIIGQLIQGFTALSLEMLAECPVLEVLLEKEEEEMKRASVANSSGEVEQQSSILAPGILGKLEDTLVDDIGEFHGKCMIECFEERERDGGHMRFSVFFCFCPFRFRTRQFPCTIS